MSVALPHFAISAGCRSKARLKIRRAEFVVWRARDDYLASKRGRKLANARGIDVRTGESLLRARRRDCGSHSRAAAVWLTSPVPPRRAQQTALRVSPAIANRNSLASTHDSRERGPGAPGRSGAAVIGRRASAALLLSGAGRTVSACVDQLRLGADTATGMRRKLRSAVIGPGCSAAPAARNQWQQLTSCAAYDASTGHCGFGSASPRVQRYDRCRLTGRHFLDQPDVGDRPRSARTRSVCVLPARDA